MMPKTAFRSRHDGFSFNGLPLLDEEAIHEIQRLFREAIDAALDSIKPGFGYAIEIYDIENILAGWVQKDLPESQVLSASLAVAVLDYYYAALSKPKLSEKTRSRLQEYLLKRLFDHIKANAARRLQWMAISRLIPVSWIPETFITEPIKQAIKRLGVYEDPVIELDLKLPNPGGEAWVTGRIKEEWELLKKNIDRGKPFPLTLIRDSENPYQNETAIAYGYEDQGDGQGIISVYYPARPQEEAPTIAIDFRGEVISLRENCEQKPGKKLAAFFSETYTTTVPPAFSWWRFWLFRMLRKVIVKTIRWIRLRLIH
jgi:hypothetical protein